LKEARDWPISAGLLKGPRTRLSSLSGANYLIRRAAGLTGAIG